MVAVGWRLMGSLVGCWAVRSVVAGWWRDCGVGLCFVGVGFYGPLVCGVGWWWWLYGFVGGSWGCGCVERLWSVVLVLE